jgi:hypothetical protein
MSEQIKEIIEQEIIKNLKIKCEQSITKGVVIVKTTYNGITISRSTIEIPT